MHVQDFGMQIFRLLVQVNSSADENSQKLYTWCERNLNTVLFIETIGAWITRF